MLIGLILTPRSPESYTLDMPDNDLRKRIEALNGRPLTNVPVAPVEVFDKTPPVRLRKPKSTVQLEDVIAGVVTQASTGPGYYHIEQPAVELEADARPIHHRFVSLTGHPDGCAVDRICHLCKSKRIHPEKILFLDIETTGLSSTPLFLIGTMECADGEFLFKQYFARNFSEEASVLAAISQRLDDISMLVTFNGKSFDFPYIQNRCAAWGVKIRQPKSHLDLLHEARGKYRRDLPNCKLQTLEQLVCGRCREDDIPGSEIPRAYNDFVRTGNASKISRILTHNLYDLLTMADLMSRMWGREYKDVEN